MSKVIVTALCHAKGHRDCTYPVATLILVSDGLPVRGLSPSRHAGNSGPPVLTHPTAATRPVSIDRDVVSAGGSKSLVLDACTACHLGGDVAMHTY